MAVDREQELGIKPGSNYDVWRTPILDQYAFNSLSDNEKLKYLFSFGVMAASSHNTQPEAVSFRSDGRGMEIFINKARVLKASDKSGRQASLSVGWTIANIEIAAIHYGIVTGINFLNIKPDDIKPVTGSKDFVEVARLNFVNSDTQPEGNHLLKAILNHRVNRRIYDVRQNIPEDLLASIKEIPHTGLDLQLIRRGQGRIQIFSELQSRADGEVASLPEFANELAHWLMPNDTADVYGMPGDTFGMDNETTKKIIEGLTDTNKMTAAELGAFARASRSGIESAAIVGMLTSKKDKPVNWVSAGYDLGKIANKLESQNVTLAIHAGLAEVPGVRQVVSALLAHTTDVPFILFRAGYPRAGEILPPHSPRATIESFII